MTPGRNVAVKVLDRVERGGAHAAAVLESHLAAVTDRREAALASHLVLGVLRSRSWLDRLLDGASTRGLGGIDPTVRNMLRVGTYQLVYMERVPARAAVSETVGQVKRSRSGGLARLANAVMRKIAAADRADLVPRAGAATLEERAVRAGVPAWLLGRFEDRLGADGAARMMEAFNRPSRRTLRVNLRRADPAELLRGLGGRGAPGRHLPWAIDAADRETARELEEGGLASFQDEGAGLVVAALDPRPGERILDSCAGRGGKTAAVAALTRGEADVTAADRQASKLERLAFELAREGLEARTVVADATDPGADVGGAFDRVLLDAPCSGTGTIGRRPEIRWRLAPGDVTSLVETQRRMLDAAAGRLRPGGRLVYAVCSVLEEEGAGHLRRLADEHPELVPVGDAPTLWPAGIPWNGGAPLVDPGLTDTDGYGILCLERRA
jgi:16S rRNA (cytosine967-C5)-methyltransferase